MKAKDVFLPMQSHNIMKILEGQKTTTIRAKETTGLTTGEVGEISFRGNQYNIINLGYLAIEEAGGKKTIIKSEGLNNEDEFMFKQSKDWVNGKGKMWVYRMWK